MRGRQRATAGHRVGNMKHDTKREKRSGLSRAGEYIVIAALLSVYGLVIFLSPDPEWVVWAGQMSVGVIDPSAVPPSLPAGAVEALHTASALSLIGILVVAVLLGAVSGIRPGWLSRLLGHAAGNHAHGGSGIGGHV